MSDHQHDRLSADLGLDYTRAEQDWDLVNSDSSRVREFLDYLRFASLGEMDQRDMVSLIVASIDDLLKEGGDARACWSDLMALVRQHPALHADTLRYWAGGHWKVSPWAQRQLDALDG